MLKKTLNRMSCFSSKYCYPIILVFSVLLSLSYVFTALDAYHIGGIIYRGVLAASFVLIFAPLFFLKNKNINLWIYILAAFYFISNIVAIFVGKAFHHNDISPVSNVSSISALFLTLFCVLVFLFQRNSGFDDKIFKISTYCYLCFVLILCAYTYIFEYKDIYNTLTNVHGWNYDVTSIFKIKTEYGNYLLIGSIISFIYFLRYKKSLFILLNFFLLFNMFLSRSKTSIILSIPLLLFFLFLVIKQEIKIHKTITIIILTISAFIVIALIALTIARVGFFSQINYYLSQTIINDGVVVLESRISNWSHALGNFNNAFAIIFGYGERIGPQVIEGCGDNFYIFSLASGGLVRVVLYISLAAYLIVGIIRNKTINTITKISIVFVQLLILLAGTTDVIGILGFTYTSLLFGYIFNSISIVSKKA